MSVAVMPVPVKFCINSTINVSKCRILLERHVRANLYGPSIDYHVSALHDVITTRVRLIGKYIAIDSVTKCYLRLLRRVSLRSSARLAPQILFAYLSSLLGRSESNGLARPANGCMQRRRRLSPCRKTDPRVIFRFVWLQSS